LVRQGSVLGATISANSLGTVVTDAENGRAETKMGNIHIPEHILRNFLDSTNDEGEGGLGKGSRGGFRN